jgi:hypothetical protein
MTPKIQGAENQYQDRRPLCCSSLQRSLDADALSSHDLAQSHDEQQGEHRAWNTESVSLKMGQDESQLIRGS